MTTPTPMKHGPSQQGRTPSQLAGATPPVSTPFSNTAHTAFSPRGPRSSPQHVKKSPANSATLLGQPNTGAINFESPSTVAAIGALGIGAAFDLGMDHVGAAGLGEFPGGFSAEDDKVKRLDIILALLNTKKGLVSEAGLARLAQRLGLELLSEDQTGPDGRKTRALIIAGSAIALDIVLDNNVVQSISLTFHESPPSVARHADAASQILLRDLQLQPGQSPLTKTLDDFAINFERLATLDKLSVSPGFDCQEALGGMYVSLERLYEWDKKKAQDDPNANDKSDHALQSAVMCVRHGIPVMHARGRVGLALQYWKQLRLAPPVNGSSELDEKVWSLVLGCAPMNRLGLTSARVSEDWISKDVVKEDASTEPGTEALDWQEPDNSKLELSEENKDKGVSIVQDDLSTICVPNVVFTVSFDPPIILPQNDWVRLYQVAGVQPPPFESGPTYDTVLFPFQSGTKQDPSEAREIRRERHVRIFAEDQQMTTRSHKNTLFIYKPIYATAAIEMHFYHPRQLIDMLPLLRQYAFLATVLENTFGSRADAEQPAKMSDDALGELFRQTTNSMTIDDELAEFLKETPKETALETTPATFEPDLSMDVILWVHPAPQMQVTFPANGQTFSVTIEILEGGTVSIVSENILDQGGDESGKGKSKEVTREKLGKVLEYMEDLGKWVEWIRTRLS